MPSTWLDMELRMERTFGSSVTLGEQVGVKRATSESQGQIRMDQEFVASSRCPPILFFDCAHIIHSIKRASLYMF